ncbi:uncharacterized protein PGTG_20986, partial [Puccinia graminis f. sp. tritici CRL 75-36-700-3]
MEDKRRATYRYTARQTVGEGVETKSLADAMEAWLQAGEDVGGDLGIDRALLLPKDGTTEDNSIWLGCNKPAAVNLAAQSYMQGEERATYRYRCSADSDGSTVDSGEDVGGDLGTDRSLLLARDSTTEEN